MNRRAVTDTVQTVDVAIIGSGPAGLATAIAIQRACPDLDVHVYERASALLPVGGAIGFAAPNTWRALRAIGPDVVHAVQARGYFRERFEVTDCNGRLLHESHPNLAEDPDRRSVVLAWYNLQQALLQFIPSDHLHLRRELKGIQESDSHSTLRFSNGMEVQAKIVVGADGNASYTREYVHGKQDKIYLGSAVWRFWLPDEGAPVELGTTRAMTACGKILALQKVFVDNEIKTYVSAMTSWPADRVPELTQVRYIQSNNIGEDESVYLGKLQRFKQMFQGYFSDEIVDYVIEASTPQSVLEHGIYATDLRHPWVRGRVALAGDAAHVMPPNMAQGTSQAFEDAVAMGRALSLHGLTHDALLHYEKIRKERILPIWYTAVTEALSFYQDQVEQSNPFMLNPEKRASRLSLADMLLDYHPETLAPSCLVDHSTGEMLAKELKQELCFD